MANEAFSGASPESAKGTPMVGSTNGNLTEDAAAFLRENEDAVASLSACPGEIKRQGDLLVEWAQRRSVIFTEDYFNALDRHEGETAEHEVFIRNRDKSAVKRTRSGKCGLAIGSEGKLRNATPSFYFERIRLMNEVFFTDVHFDVRFEGMCRLPNTNDPSIVTSQKWVDALDENAPHPTEEEIKEFMMGLDFCLFNGGVHKWYREDDRIIIADARHHNFIKSVSGLVPIDLLINKRITFD